MKSLKGGIKMVNKCWKRMSSISKRNHEIFKNKDGEHIHVFSSHPVAPIGIKLPDKWVVSYPNGRREVKDKKTQAISSAKRYMKKSC